MTQPSFDPFSIDDDDYDDDDKKSNSNTNNGNVIGGGQREGTVISASGASSRTNRKQHGMANGSSLQSMSNSISTTTTSKLPARLTVTLVLHEEVSSTAILDSTHKSGSTSSQLDIEGKLVVSSSN